MLSYEKRIVEYMKTHHGITVGECRDKIGTTELRRRICDLKEKGYEIKSVWEEGPNSNDTTSRYCRYFLIKEPDPELLEKKKARKLANKNDPFIKGLATLTKALDKKLDKVDSPLYDYDYIGMVNDMCNIRGEEKKK